MSTVQFCDSNARFRARETREKSTRRVSLRIKGTAAANGRNTFKRPYFDQYYPRRTGGEKRTAGCRK